MASSPPSSASNGSSSYVKNMLEEAARESAVNSGHTSADEVDTTTSSDIEVISHTSMMSGMSLRHLDISPSRQLHSQGGASGGGGGVAAGRQNVLNHRRSDSGSSAQSIQSSRYDYDYSGK